MSNQNSDGNQELFQGYRPNCLIFFVGLLVLFVDMCLHHCELLFFVVLDVILVLGCVYCLLVLDPLSLLGITPLVDKIMKRYV